MKCTKVTFIAFFEDDVLIDNHSQLPFAFLHVEAPELKKNTFVAVRHKLDFLNVWDLHKQDFFAGPYFEVHVRYKTQKGLKKLLWSFLPYLEFSVYSEGTFEDYELLEQSEDFEPVHKLYGRERDPLFGDYNL